MALRKMLDALTGKKDIAIQKGNEDSALPAQLSDQFPVYRSADININQYKKMPLMGMAALGGAFAQLPVSARTIVQTVTSNVATKETLFVGINPKGVQGFLRANQFGTVGNIMNFNEQGKQVIAGRMRFKALEGGLPINTSTLTTIPLDPMTMVIAAALMHLEQKFDDLQKIAEEILQFLKLDKQSKQRGNLNMLGEILEDYKKHHENADFCRLRNVEVQTIKREAHQDILFYQERIAKELKEQKAIHLTQQAQDMLNAIMSEFYEYQLACYLYSFSTFLDLMLQKNFDSSFLASTVSRMEEHAGRYAELYNGCRAQIENYYKTSIETQVVGGFGFLAKALGNAIASVPILRDGPVDELLINAGESISEGEKGRQLVKMEQFAVLDNDRMRPFIDNIREIDLLQNNQNAMLIDSEYLYILSPTHD